MNLLNFLKQSLKGELSIEIQREFLESKTKITPKELADAVRFLQKQAPKKLKLKHAIDVCGTGGSGLERINTSTISAFILARLGVPVAKHGNKAASGRFGSFDLLESLGIEFTDQIPDIERKYKAEGLAFLFAPFFHPVMKNFAALRRQITKPTFFNLLGPLLNPAFPKRQIIGTAFKNEMSLIAETCKLLGKEKVYIVCGEDGLDEVTLSGRTFVTELAHGKIKSYTIKPEDFGLDRAAFPEIQGGDAKFNTQIASDILRGTCETRHQDLVLVNCALALKLVDKAKTLKEAYEMASIAIHAPSILLKIVEQKRKEVEVRKGSRPLGKLYPSTRDFYGALKGGGLSLIAEVKKASPSAGVLCRSFSLVDIAQKYERYGASAISVVCDKKFFGGDLKYLKKIAESTFKIPLLCKDFIIDEYQIYEARKYGADAILLIAAILSEQQISKFIKTAKGLKMAALCEVHTLEELQKVLRTPAEIIGINNRDLHTFKVDNSTTAEIAQFVPEGKLIVSESGFSSKSDLRKLPQNVDAVLVGTALMTGGKISEFVDRKVKICGVRTVKDANLCEKIGVNFIGLNFVPSSKRRVTLDEARLICESVKKVAKVGVFQNQSLETVNTIARKLDLDYIQVAGEESLSMIRKCCKPVIKTISVRAESDLKKAEKYLPYTAYVLLDGVSPGTGTPIAVDLRNVKYPFLLAGGISPSNVESAVNRVNPLGIDVAGGVETEGKLDPRKVRLLLKKLKQC